MTQTEEKSFIMTFAKSVERIGNKIPHPMYLFLYLTVILIVVSAICAAVGVSVTYNVTNSEGQLVEKTAKAVNMLSPEGFMGLISGLLNNYKNMPTLALVIMLGIGMAVSEQSGFLSAMLRKSMLALPRKAVVYALSVIGICANICGDAGMILAPTLGAMVYQSVGRNPWIGIITGYSAAAAGYTACLLPASIDANLSAMSQQALDAVGITGCSVNILSNYYFNFTATFVLAAVVTVISETFLTKYLGDKSGEASLDALKDAQLTKEENRGLRWAGIAFIISTAILLVATVPEGAVFRNPATGKLLPTSPFMSSLVPFFFLYFVILGCAYGVGAGVIRKTSDVPIMMQKGVQDMASLCVVFFFVSVMLHVFNTSNLATIISVSGERFLRSIGLDGLPLLVLFIVIIAFLNFFMYSATAKWLLFAPIFIPMFANLDIHPAITQMAYRIGDSCTNSITPLNACLVACITLLNKYRDPEINKEEAGVGTVMSTVSVFCFAMLFAFIILFAVFYIFDIPFGVGM